MIKRVEIKGLNGLDDLELDFKPNLNILTGRNGCGKTTIMKLLWYMMSANRELILGEINFKSIRLITTSYEFVINTEDCDNSQRKKATFNYKGCNGIEMSRVIEHNKGAVNDSDLQFLRELNRAADKSGESTFFFPTFRRVEGGFAIDHLRRWATYGDDVAQGLNVALKNFAEALSSESHEFVTSISTTDIERLLISRYADLSEKSNNLHLDFSRTIRERLISSQEDGKVVGAEAFREYVKERVEQVDENRKKLMRPIDTLNLLVQKVFQEKGVKFGDNLSFGQTKKALRANVLSAGEKQMLGFLCYNAFAKNAVIFIDEPELSLHVDWQRTLFRMMFEQNMSNQFVVATHSPFIYSAYPECELMLTTDKGL